MANVDLGRFNRMVQMFWDPEPRNDDPQRSSIWCLGSHYHSIPATADSGDEGLTGGSNAAMAGSFSMIETSTLTDDSGSGSWESGLAYSEPGVTTTVEEAGWPSVFLDDFEAKIWMTYRSGFPPIPKSTDPTASSAMTLAVRLRSLAEQSGFTSDTGWACMIRSGQSLIANALLFLQLGRSWRRGKRETEEAQLLSLFADDPKAPLSIHKFVEHGEKFCGKHPGEWFGPSATANCIEALINKHDAANLRVYVAGDGSDVYQDSFMKVAKPEGESFHPTLLLVGTRLGIDRITPAYWESLKAALKLKQSVGIAGGRPSASHYFIGVQGSHFFYLDPHHTRPALPLHAKPDEYTADEISSCHTRRLRRIHIKDMDPSMLIAFLIRDEADWSDWRRSITEKVTGKPVVRVSDVEPVLAGEGSMRPEALDEVESFDDEDDEIQTEGEKIDLPQDGKGDIL